MVSPEDVAVLDPTPFAQLTLTTCNPRYSATSRLIIVARWTGRLPATPAVPAVAQPGPPPRARQHHPPCRAGGRRRQPRPRRPGAWPPALAFGALVVVLWIGVRILVNRTRRWTRAGVLVAGIAVCLVPLWFAFENAVRLLPPNI